jgi:uncharacterized protein (TIGR00730 family)
VEGVRRICIFSGSRPGTRPAYAAAARALGEVIAGAGIGLVYGGASVGLMRTVADAAMAKGGEVIGVIPKSLVDREVAHTGLTELRVVGTMHERKALMASLADAFVALPGGFGTLDELFEIVTWSQLGLHAKPIGLLDESAFWRPLMSFLDHVVAEGFVPEDQLQLFLLESDPATLLARMRTWSPPALGPKWIDAEDT